MRLCVTSSRRFGSETKAMPLSGFKFLPKARRALWGVYVGLAKHNLYYSGSGELGFY